MPWPPTCAQWVVRSSPIQRSSRLIYSLPHGPSSAMLPLASSCISRVLVFLPGTSTNSNVTAMGLECSRSITHLTGLSRGRLPNALAQGLYMSGAPCLRLPVQRQRSGRENIPKGRLWCWRSRASSMRRAPRPESIPPGHTVMSPTPRLLIWPNALRRILNASHRASAIVSWRATSYHPSNLSSTTRIISAGVFIEGDTVSWIFAPVPPLGGDPYTARPNGSVFAVHSVAPEGAVNGFLGSVASSALFGRAPVT